MYVLATDFAWVTMKVTEFIIHYRVPNIIINRLVLNLRRFHRDPDEFEIPALPAAFAGKSIRGADSCIFAVPDGHHTSTLDRCLDEIGAPLDSDHWHHHDDDGDGDNEDDEQQNHEPEFNEFDPNVTFVPVVSTLHPFRSSALAMRFQPSPALW